ncbi:MAG: putative HAF family extracellular repeat protein [Planctomycetota bacterium]|jgi:probable HAF family extracellular repeat protein
MNHFTRLAAVSIALVTPTLGQASFDGLGFLPDQVAPWSEAHGVSADGRLIVGFARRPDQPHAYEPFVWTAFTGMLPLGTLDASETSSGRASAVSGDGRTVTGTVDVGGSAQAMDWRRMVGMAPLGSLPLSIRSDSKAVSSDGSVVVGKSFFFGGSSYWHEATAWRAGVIARLGHHPGALRSEAMGVSDDGQVIVGFADRTYLEGQSAFRWTQAQGFEILGDLQGGWHWSQANDANHDGSIIVGHATSTFGTASFGVDHRAAIWTEGTGFVKLDELPSSGASSALDVSSNGRFIAGWARRFGTTRPVIWRDRVPIDVIEFMEQQGMDLSDWSLSEATSISDDGRVVVGWGRRASSGTSEAWRAILP